MNSKKGLPLRITLNDKDYQYQVNQINKIADQSFSMEVEIEGQRYELQKSLGRWIVPDQLEQNMEELIAIICKNLSLRYRI